MATNNQSYTTDHDPATTEGGTGSGGFVEDSGLNGSFRGLRQLDLEAAAFFYAFCSSDSNGSDRELMITPESLAHDVKRLRCLAGQFEGLRGKVYSAERVGREATAKVIRSVMAKLCHDLPIVVAILLHTELRDGKQAFIPADPSNLVPHSDISRWLLRSRGTAPVALLTESCYSTNMMGLPFKCFVDGQGQLVWEQIHDCDNQEWELVPLMVQLAATMPGEQAATFGSVGSVYTRALYNAWRKPFGSMMTSMQEDMDSTLEGRDHQQHHVIYSSRIIGDDEILWLALGLEFRS